MKKYVAVGLLICGMIFSVFMVDSKSNAETVPGVPPMGIVKLN